MEEHDCCEGCKGLDYRDGRVYIEFDAWVNDFEIHYCPFCGIKLVVCEENE